MWLAAEASVYEVGTQRECSSRAHGSGSPTSASEPGELGVSMSTRCYSRLLFPAAFPGCFSRRRAE